MVIFDQLPKLPMKLLPIKKHLYENEQFTNDPDCQDSIYVTVDFFKKVGYEPPWVSYYAEEDDRLVGAGAFKGKPTNGKVEIAYMVFPQCRQQGFGNNLVKALIQLALKTDPLITVTAKTLAEENFSTRILKKNNFNLLGTVMDEEGGEVWEWGLTLPSPLERVN